MQRRRKRELRAPVHRHSGETGPGESPFLGEALLSHPELGHPPTPCRAALSHALCSRGTTSEAAVVSMGGDPHVAKVTISQQRTQEHSGHSRHHADTASPQLRNQFLVLEQNLFEHVLLVPLPPCLQPPTCFLVLWIHFWRRRTNRITQDAACVRRLSLALKPRSKNQSFPFPAECLAGCADQALFIRSPPEGHRGGSPRPPPPSHRE